MSGHSKWATTKHKKALVDAKKSSIFTKLAKIISVAARNGADSDMNFQLRMAIDKARAFSMPKENIERAIAKGAGIGEQNNLEEITYEGYGPEGVAIIIELVTDNKNRSASEIRHILSKTGGSLGASNSVLWQFEKRGVIYLKNTELSDEQELLIIDAGADDIEKTEDGIMILTSIENLQKTQEKLKDVIEIENAEVEYIAKNKVKMQNPEKLEKLIEMLDENDDVNNFYTNAE
ncbi:MAG: YebC/PmpR family DNA-binding transcriptional regulator [Patescibacteria group bacterium]|nr:YebC/PmpR family DNA-binding transcriptional regulator [Patescibacteria group bacterium]MDD4303946.1 YebC/PmpR family DNA-binding transcriptional regulator [Patescibacteria group bacterium]MDD4695066.1 YebC/PmpR family DNA-binding transcriptional regulator [Patescibacteria group bacterium]